LVVFKHLRRTQSIKEKVNAMSNSDDFDAIKTYFASQTPKTAAGVDIKTAFTNWEPTIDRGWLTGFGTTNTHVAQAKKYRDDYNAAEFPKAVAAQASNPQLTKAEQDYVMGMPIVNTTGLTAEQAHAAVWSAPRNEAPAGSAFSDKSKAAAVAATHKTIKQGSPVALKPDIIAWQNIIGIKADGIFGAQTKAATIAWQKKNGLTADGVVGPATWKKAADLAAAAVTTTPGTTPTVTPPATVTPTAQVAAVTGQNTVKPAVNGAAAKDKPVVAAVTTGAVTTTPTAVKTTTGATDSTFAKAVETINEKAKVAEAGVASLPGSKWAWGLAIGTFLAAAAYAVFGHPKFDQRKKLNG
jgi:peptidoglycan hydrolase-like protein with peptidoglycan-binding domain